MYEVGMYGGSFNPLHLGHVNDIIQAAYTGTSTKDATIYVTVTPCFTCGKMIVNAGIKEVVVSGEYPDERTRELFDEVGVTIRKI